MKKETLEDAIGNWIDNNCDRTDGLETLNDAIRFGAKWQQETMYSETEVLQLLLRLQQTESYNNLYEWFEQNKKK